MLRSLFESKRISWSSPSHKHAQEAKRQQYQVVEEERPEMAGRSPAKEGLDSPIEHGNHQCHHDEEICPNREQVESLLDEGRAERHEEKYPDIPQCYSDGHEASHHGKPDSEEG